MVPSGTVIAVSRDGAHRFSKVSCGSITLVAGFGVIGDAHGGALVQHRSRVRRDPSQPNLRQVHLLPSEFLEQWRAAGHDLGAGDFGENILTADLDLHALSAGTRLLIGEVVLRVTGLRNPCRQIDEFSPGLLRLVVARADGAATNCRAGIMAVVERGGEIRPGTAVVATLPPRPHALLQPV